ncbi:hypothetical protein [Dictyobacter aurantiacus]|uniref:hypothetical protein n=1 Tax=Dictyobacter aurantiacus TaxID=1936993 RepID=UPI000F8463D1|nr:hypothetical protein [Dictyobacter aurantiacus]
MEEGFLHCAKSIKRSKLWEQASWPDLAALPSIGQMFHDHTHIADKTAQQLDAYLEEDYQHLY